MKYLHMRGATASPLDWSTAPSEGSLWSDFYKKNEFCSNFVTMKGKDVVPSHKPNPLPNVAPSLHYTLI